MQRRTNEGKYARRRDAKYHFLTVLPTVIPLSFPTGCGLFPSLGTPYRATKFLSDYLLYHLNVYFFSPTLLSQVILSVPFPFQSQATGCGILLFTTHVNVPVPFFLHPVVDCYFLLLLYTLLLSYRLQTTQLARGRNFKLTFQLLIYCLRGSNRHRFFRLFR